MAFFVTFKPWLSVRPVFYKGACLATSVHVEVATQFKVAAKLQADKVASCQV